MAEEAAKIKKGWFARHPVMGWGLVMLVVGFFVLGISSAMEQSQAISTVQGRMGLSTEEAEQLKEDTINISKQTGIGFQDVALGIGGLYNAMGRDIHAAAEVAELLAKATKVTREDFSEAVPVVGELLQKLGIEDVNEASALVESLFKSASLSGLSIKDTVTDLEDFAVAARVADLPAKAITESIAVFGAMVAEMGREDAKTSFRFLAETIEGTEAGRVLTGGDTKGFIRRLNAKGPVAAFDEISAKIKELSN